MSLDVIHVGFLLKTISSFCHQCKYLKAQSLPKCALLEREREKAFFFIVECFSSSSHFVNIVWMKILLYIRCEFGALDILWMAKNDVHNGPSQCPQATMPNKYIVDYYDVVGSLPVVILSECLWNVGFEMQFLMVSTWIRVSVFKVSFFCKEIRLCEYLLDFGHYEVVSTIETVWNYLKEPSQRWIGTSSLNHTSKLYPK